MTSQSKWWRAALVILVLLIAAQAAVPLLVRTRRVHNYLIARLERDFGRPVQVAHFSAQILPTPQLDAEQITVGEDPAFGYEYFLRAERLGASVRWQRLLRGHFEFGTLSLSRPSLILVRNSAGKWNLEGWLPPAKSNAAEGARIYGPQVSAAPPNHLEKIMFDDGRINFKNAEEKLPFAFTNVSGSVEQVAAGRWQLQLEAQPWRSGVALQSTGTFAVRGDIAGTSARLQPAEISVHWDKVSLADLFRLLTGKDYGVRGEIALEGGARSASLAKDGAADVSTAPGNWTFSVQARSMQIHRWDLTERPDNPRVNVSMKGHWNAAAGWADADEVKLETRKSNLRGTAKFSFADAPWWQWHVDSAGIQAEDLLAWYHAFHSGVAEGVSAQQFFTGAMTLSGWPVTLEDAAFSSAGGVIRMAPLEEELHIGAVHGGRVRGKFILEPMRVALVAETQGAAGTTKTASRSTKHHAGGELQNAVEITITHNFDSHEGVLALHGSVERIEEVLASASSFGQTLNHGWFMNGPANVALQWVWKEAPAQGRWGGTVALSGGELLAAGLNLPLRIEEVRLEWKEGRRGATIGRIGGFGASWSGEVAETPQTEGSAAPRWSFQLHADHLDATELDRWIGPRARPSWLERLLPWLARGAPGVVPAELLRGLDAQGELRVDELTVEKLKLSQVRAEIALRDLQLNVNEAEAQWAGGKVSSKMSARFIPRPKYQVAANLDGVNLALLTAAESLIGTASGRVQLITEGVGREELLGNLGGNGEIHLKKVEFRAWDVGASFVDGALRAGISRWTTGDGLFAVRDRKIFVDELRLNTGPDQMLVEGSVNFAREADLTIRAGSSAKHEKRAENSGRVLKVSGPLSEPKVTVEKLVAAPASD